MGGDVFSLQVRYYAGRTFCVTRLHYKVVDDGGFNQDTALELAQHFRTTVIENTWGALAGENCVCVELYCRRIYPTPDVPASILLAHSGHLLFDHPAPSAPLCISHYGEGGSRQSRGRSYWSIVPWLYCDAGAINDVGMVLANNLAQSLIFIPAISGPPNAQWQLCTTNLEPSEAINCVTTRANPNLRVMRTRIARRYIGG